MSQVRSDFQNYVGLDLDGALFCRNRHWLKALRIDPDNTFRDLANTLVEVVRDLGSSFAIGGAYHFAASLNEMFGQKEFLVPYLRSTRELSIPYKSVIHMPFNSDCLPLSEGFVQMLGKQMDICDRIRCDCIVAHPPRTPTNKNRQWIEELTHPQVKKTLRDKKITLCFENIDYSGDYYESIAHLVEWRAELVQHFGDSGDSDLAKYVRFCFDTGHYQIYRQRDEPKPKVIEKQREGHNERALGEDLFKDFVEMTKVFHISTNDGTADHHILPFSNKKSIRVKGTFNREQFQKNSIEVSEWIQLAQEIETDIHDRYWILEIEPPFSLRKVHALFKQLFPAFSQEQT